MTAVRRPGTTALVAAGQLAMNGAAYAFSIVAARILIPAEFGAVTALLGLLQVGIVVSLGLQAAAARRIAVDQADRDEVIGQVLRSTAAVSLAVGISVAVAAPPLTWALQLDSIWPALLCAATLVPLTAMGGFIGIAQGSEQWNHVTVIALGNGFGRLLAGAIALSIYPSATSAMIGVALGAWSPVLFGAMAFGTRALKTGSRRPLIGETFTGTHTLFAFYTLSNLDALIARNQLSAHQAGLYAAGLILTKAALMAPSFVGVLLYPRFARDRTTATREAAVLTVVALGTLATSFTFLFPHLALALAGGPQYAEIAGQLWLFTLAGSIWAVVQVLVLDSLARRRAGTSLILWATIALLVALVLALNISVTDLIITVATVGLAVAIILARTDRR